MKSNGAKYKKDIRDMLKSQFHNGRAAGTGVIEDNYDEESFPNFNPHARRTERGKMSSQYIPKAGDPYSKESVKDKNGEVIIIQPAKEKV